jgi:hypothetical protein
MKNINFLVTLFFFSCFITLQSCVPDPPPKPIGYVLKKSDKLIEPTGGQKYDDSGPNCPMEGDNCIIPVYAPNTNGRQLVINEWLGFKSYYDNNNVPAYFQQTHSWESLFPTFRYHQGMVDNIINRTYKTHIFFDSTIVVYKNSNWYGDNLVYTVRIK